MKYFYVLSSLAIFLSCSLKNSQDYVEENAPASQFDSLTYTEFLEKVEADIYGSSIIEKKNLLFAYINEALPHYWMGTPWTFTGHTTQPKSGEIACGYFVTNTLHALGFKINRFKLAQEVSSVMIRQLTVNEKRFSSIGGLKEYLSKQEENDAFIIGLDFHTGYVTKQGSNFYFIHSNYIDNQGVVKEKLEESEALKQSNSFVVGSLIQNEKLVNEW